MLYEVITATDRCKTVWCECEKAFHCRTSRYVLDVRVEPPVLVNDKHSWERTLPRRLDQVAAHVAGGSVS